MSAPPAGYPMIEAAIEAEGLIAMGACMEDQGTLLMVGAGPGFWETFRAAPEYSDNLPDPLDRWSLRVVTALADRLGAIPVFPFGGPPYAPFIAWAKRTGRAFDSPTGMLVHDRVGLMISYRGALQFDRYIQDVPPAPGLSPCDDCPGRPCVAACPVGALSADSAYDVAACHSFLDGPDGGDCMEQGCAVRRACPLSAGAARDTRQSAFHMRSFHPK
jgi:hypothetical protein